MTSHTSTASVVIRCRNESSALGATLDAVLGQRPPPLEVLVIDAASTDGSPDIARSRGVRVVDVSPVGWSYGRALNLGAEAASGEVVVALSAHCVPLRDDWLESLLRHFDDPQTAAVWGPEVPSAMDPDAVGGPPRLVAGPTDTHRLAQFGPSNANAAIRRATWRDLPFDEELPAGEDKEWAARALRAGHVLVYEPKAAVLHPPHAPLHEMRRAYAVAAGLREAFPEEARRRPGLVVSGVASTGRRLWLRVRRGDVRGLCRDLAQLPRRIAVGVARIAGSGRPRG